MIRRQVVVPVDPERLWAALTDPDEVAAWLGGRVEWEVSEGAPLRFHGNAGEMRDGRIDVVWP
ncbi:MAG: SRPBCC family protein, partial [Acidimicrobiales bacterium]